MQATTKSNLDTHLPEWLESCRRELIEPRREAIEKHPFTIGMLNGEIPAADAERYFSGLMWHLNDFGKHVRHLFSKRPAVVGEFLKGRSEDKDGDTDILARIVEALGGPVDKLKHQPWSYKPHPIWITHDSLLRSAIYSVDLPWQVGAAALNLGIETLVPTMITPLFEAAVRKYNISKPQAAWLESRSGEEEKQHGENGWLLLAHFVDSKDIQLQSLCRTQIDALSYSMAYGLLTSGMPLSSAKKGH